MSDTIITEYAIGDLVFTATVRDVDKEVIKAIKIVGVKKRISYGIQSRSQGGLLGSLWGGGDGYRWYSGSDIFTTLEAAESRQKTLEAREAEKETAKHQKEIIDLERRLKIDQENLRRKKAGLPLLEDDEDYDD